MQHLMCVKHLTRYHLLQRGAAHPPLHRLCLPLLHSLHQAVEADGVGRHNAALELYFKLLECLNRCHALETVPACQAAIMARFQVRLQLSTGAGGSAVQPADCYLSCVGFSWYPSIVVCYCTQVYLERAEQLQTLLQTHKKS